MPIRNVPIPTVLPNTILVKTQIIKDQSGPQDSVYSDHWFYPTGAVPPFNILTAALDCLARFINPVFTFTLPNNMNTVAFHIFANVWTHVQSQFVSPSFAGRRATTDSIGPQFKVRIAKRGLFGSQFLVNYTSYPPVPKGYVTDNDVNPTGAAVYAASLGAYENGWITHGVLFLPCNVSLLHNIAVPTLEMKRCRYIRICRKSRIKDPSHRYDYRWPLVP